MFRDERFDGDQSISITQLLHYLGRLSDNIYCHHQDLCVDNKGNNQTHNQLDECVCVWGGETVCYFSKIITILAYCFT